MKYNKIRKFEMNDENPFIDQTVMHVEKGHKYIMVGNQGDMIVDKNGDIKGHTVFAKKEKIDKAEFRKIYISTLVAWFGLSKTGLRVLTYIMSVLKPNSDSFEFIPEKCMEFTGYKSKNSVLSGMAELLENDFIARGYHSFKYFVNPTIFYNGDRISLLKQYEVNDTDKKIEPPKK